MKWEDDYPVIGEDKGGYGVPVSEYKKPDVNKEYPISYIQTSDDFKGNKLGLQWQWNANYKKDWYEMTGEGIKLYAVKNEEKTAVSDMANLLLQKWAFPEFTAECEIETENMKNGDIAGMVQLGMKYAALCVKKNDDRAEIVLVKGEQKFIDEIAHTKEENEAVSEKYSNIDKIYFRNTVMPCGKGKENETIWKSALYYSIDGVKYDKAYEDDAVAGRWVGVKHGVFCSHIGDDEGGYVKVNYFKYLGD